MPKNGFPVLEQPKFRNFMYFDVLFRGGKASHKTRRPNLSNLSEPEIRYRLCA